MVKVLFLLIFLIGSSLCDSCDLYPLERLECGHLGIKEDECHSKGCCWAPYAINTKIPWCFHKLKQCDGYYANNFVETTSMITAELSILNANCNRYGRNIERLKFFLEFESDSRIHLKITDADAKRWEIPENIVPISKSEKRTDWLTGKNATILKRGKTQVKPFMKMTKENKAFRVELSSRPFNFAIIRKSDGQTIFNTSSGTSDVLVFEEQFLEVSTGLPEDANIYGLGESIRPYRLEPDNTRATLFSRDAASPVDQNLYGAHPFYLEMRNGVSHGVFLRNSNGMDVILKRGSLTYRVLGGVFDFYFFAGPKPADVVKQYQEVIGKPAMVPYWSLGFHQCRYGYQNIWEVEQVVDGFAREKIPLEAMWTDIEYMDGYRDFTFDQARYPLHEVRRFKKKLKEKNQKYVLIVDPGIKIDKGLKSYDQGIEMDVFMKNADGSTMVGSVWPGLVHFPDFFHPRAQQYWDQSFKDFFELLDLDGVWIDMNELANFCDGDCRKKPEPSKTAIDVNYPPYKINNGGYQMPLFFRTTSMDAVHYGGIREYDVHNLYGLMEAKATYNTMLKLHPDQRPFILSRSTFSGSGKYTAHWTGDNWSTWAHMHYAIIGILNFQLYGIPFVGADICGFGGDTTEQLCARWTSIGSFYPFSRNHNEIKGIPQEPYLWDSVSAIARKYLGIRYQLLPYWYTLFEQASRDGSTVIRSLMFEWPKDPETYGNDKQILVGDAILVTPVLEKDANAVQGYFPQGVWYDWHTHARFSLTDGGEYKTIEAPIDHLPIHVRGGSVIPMQDAALTVTANRETPFSLLIALDGEGEAKGSLYLDDGISFAYETRDEYSRISVTAQFKSLYGQIRLDGQNFKYDCKQKLQKVTVMGIPFRPSTIYHSYENGHKQNRLVKGWTYDEATAELTLQDVDVSLNEGSLISIEKAFNAYFY